MYIDNLQRAIDRVERNVAATRTEIKDTVEAAEQAGLTAIAAEKVAKLANQLAEYEASLALLTNALNKDWDSIRRMVVSRVMVGPDDGWSGRSNDVRRSAFDGTRKTGDALLDFCDDFGPKA